MSMVKINNANKTYNKGKSNALHVINNASLELPSTGMVAIFGPSGCGKTTLLNVIGGLDRLDSGVITIDDKVINPNQDQLRNKYIGYIFQNYNLNIKKTVYENVSDALYLCGMTDSDEIDKRVKSALRNVEMENYSKRTPDSLSGGQMQRVAIARAIVKNPHIILADEPTGNLDEINTIMVMDLLKEIAKEHLIILVTHELDLVEHYCDKIVEVKDGQIVNIKDNELVGNDQSSLAKNKNHIYLGDLPSVSNKINNVEVNIYGSNIIDNLVIDLVNIDGKYYLQTNDKSVKFINNESEVKLKQGKYQDLVDELKTNKKKNNAHIDMTNLTSFEGHNYGRLFTLKNSIKDAFKGNFKKKKGEKLLLTALITLGFALVFTIAKSGVGLGNLINERKTIPQDAIYIPLGKDIDTNFIYNEIGNHGIESMQIIDAQTLINNNTITINTANFVSSRVAKIVSTTRIYDDARLKNTNVIIGKKEINDNEVVISNTLADNLLDASTVSYVKEYKDLIGLSFSTLGGNKSIVGIVESSDLALYQTSDSQMYNLFYNSPYSYDTNIFTIDLKDDEIYTFGDGLKFTDGQEVYIHGNKFKVKKSYTYHNIGLANFTSTLDHDVAFEKYKSEHPSEDLFKLRVTYLYENIFSDEILQKCFFAKYLVERSPSNLALLDGLMASNDELLKFFATLSNTMVTSMIGTDETHGTLALQYKLEKGVFPTYDEMNDYINESDIKLEEYTFDFQNKLENFRNNVSGTYHPKYIFMTKQAAQKLSKTYGKTDEHFNAINVYENNTEEHNTSSHYLMVTSSNLAETISFVNTKLHDSKFITPEEEVSYIISEYIYDFIISMVTVIIIIAFMCLSVFAIMRSRFMSKVKEVGIYRAIGVSRKNLTFKYLIESLVVTLCTTFISFIISTIIIWMLSKQPLFTSMFYFPFWVALITLVIILAVCLLFGTLPAILLLRKTPSEILAKYDI